MQFPTITQLLTEAAQSEQPSYEKLLQQLNGKLHFKLPRLFTQGMPSYENHEARRLRPEAWLKAFREPSRRKPLAAAKLIAAALMHVTGFTLWAKYLQDEEAYLSQLPPDPRGYSSSRNSDRSYASIEYDRVYRAFDREEWQRFDAALSDFIEDIFEEAEIEAAEVDLDAEGSREIKERLSDMRTLVDWLKKPENQLTKVPYEHGKWDYQPDQEGADPELGIFRHEEVAHTFNFSSSHFIRTLDRLL